MTDDLSVLAERLENATGPDRGLDELISAAIQNAVREVQSDGRVAYHSADGSRWVSVTVGSYSTSLDAAMSLVPPAPDALSEHWKVEAYTDNGVLAEHVRASAWVLGARRCFAATPALALCAAALRARSQENSNHED